MEMRAAGGIVEVGEKGLFVKAKKPFKFEKPFSGLVPYRTVKPIRVHEILARAYYENFRNQLQETFPGNPAAKLYTNVEKRVLYMRVLAGNKDAGVAFNNLGVYAFMKGIRPYVTRTRFVDSDGVEWTFEKKKDDLFLSIKDLVGMVYKGLVSDEKRAAIEIAAEAFLRGEVRNRETFYMAREFGVTVTKNRLKISCPGGSIFLSKDQAAELLGVVCGNVEDNVFAGIGGKVEISDGIVKIIAKKEIYSFEMNSVALFEIISSIRRSLYRNKQLLRVALLSSLPEDVLEQLFRGDNPEFKSPFIAGYYSLKREKVEQNGFILNIHIFGRGAAFDVEKDGKIIASIKFRRGNLYAMEKYISTQDKEIFIDDENGRSIAFLKQTGKSFIRIGDSEIEIKGELKYFLQMSLEQFLIKGDVRPFKRTVDGVEIRTFNIFDKETGYPIAGLGVRIGNNDFHFHIGIKRALRILSAL